LSHSVLDVYLLSLIDRGQCTKYDLQRRGGVSLGSSTPALRRLRLAGLITEEETDDGTMRIRQILKLTSAGRRIGRQAWREYFDKDAELDIEAILRIVDIASHSGASKRQIVGFLDGMASQRTANSFEDDSNAEGIVGLQRQWLTTRTTAEASFLADLAGAYRRSKSGPSAKQARSKVRRRR
jgi:DNA-binding PadR family transcriptional regulator